MAHIDPAERRPWRGPLALAVVLALLLAVFGVRLPGNPALWPPPEGGDRVTVYLVDNGYHSNLVFPRARMAARDGPSARAVAGLAPGDWVSVGWGDERFFTETGFDFRRAMDGLRALFAPGNPSVTMFEPMERPPDRIWRTGVVRFEVSEAGFEAMAARIDRSLRVEGGALLPGPRGEVPQARFYKSTETFSVLKLCNHWAAGVLNAGGLPVRPVLDTWGSGLAFDLKTGALKRRIPKRDPTQS